MKKLKKKEMLNTKQEVGMKLKEKKLQQKKVEKKNRALIQLSTQKIKQKNKKYGQFLHQKELLVQELRKI